MAATESNHHLTFEQMLAKLNQLYDREENIIREVKTLRLEYQQIQEDKEFLQMMVMYQSNKINRLKQLGRQN